MPQLKDKFPDQERHIYTTEISFLEKDGRFYEKRHFKCTNPEALRVLLDRYELPSLESNFLMDCQAIREKVTAVKKTGTSAPSSAVSQKQQGRDRGKDTRPLSVSQLPSSPASLPVISRPPPPSETECDNCHGMGRVSTSKSHASRSRDSTNRMEAHSVFNPSSNGTRDAASYPKNQHKNRCPAPPKSLQGHEFANKEEYVVVDHTDREDKEKMGGRWNSPWESERKYKGLFCA